MGRTLCIAVGQSGPLQKGDSRETAVERLMAMLRRAAGDGADVIVFTELALTTFFPRYFAEHRRIEHYGRITSQTGAVEPGDRTDAA